MFGGCLVTRKGATMATRALVVRLENPEEAYEREFTKAHYFDTSDLLNCAYGELFMKPWKPPRDMLVITFEDEERYLRAIDRYFRRHPERLRQARLRKRLRIKEHRRRAPYWRARRRRLLAYFLVRSPGWFFWYLRCRLKLIPWRPVPKYEGIA
ncbi:MAG: hypothetical protein D6741_11925 [Planctomycetota bacterium]|nr:MAG: hypothetical protein D6741_11925 [Planctomycetota bacterium]